MPGRQEWTRLAAGAPWATSSREGGHRLLDRVKAIAPLLRASAAEAEAVGSKYPNALLYLKFTTR
jgi:hypothetical protein